ASTRTPIRLRPPRTLVTLIRLISLPRHWDRDRLRLPVRAQPNDQRIPLETLDDAVHDLVPFSQHHAVSARILDQRKLVLGAPDDSDHSQTSHVGRSIPADIGAHESAADQRLEWIPPPERVVVIRDALLL